MLCPDAALCRYLHAWASMAGDAFWVDPVSVIPCSRAQVSQVVHRVISLASLQTILVPMTFISLLLWLPSSATCLGLTFRSRDFRGRTGSWLPIIW